MVRVAVLFIHIVVSASQRLSSHFSSALAVISGKYEIPPSNRYSKGFISLINAMLQSRLEDRPFVPAIATRVESMLREQGVHVAAAVGARSEFDSDDENEGLTSGGKVRLDVRS